MMDGVNTRIADLKTVIGRTTQHRQTLLQSAAATLRRNYIQIRKMKSVYYILNQFSLRDGQLVMIGEGWIPTCDLSSVKGALFKAGEQSGSMITPTMEKIPTTEVHPTYHRFYNGNRNGKFNNKT